MLCARLQIAIILTQWSTNQSATKLTRLYHVWLIHPRWRKQCIFLEVVGVKGHVISFNEYTLYIAIALPATEETLLRSDGVKRDERSFNMAWNGATYYIQKFHSMWASGLSTTLLLIFGRLLFKFSNPIQKNSPRTDWVNFVDEHLSWFSPPSTVSTTVSCPIIWLSAASLLLWSDSRSVSCMVMVVLLGLRRMPTSEEASSNANFSLSSTMLSSSSVILMHFRVSDGVSNRCVDIPM